MKAFFVVALLLVASPAWAQTCCGDPDVNGSTSVSDVLRILRAGVGTGKCIPSCCDVDDSGVVNVTDALAALLGIFGGPMVCPPTEVVITYADSGSDPAFPPLAGTQFDIETAGAGFTLPQGPDPAGCDLLPSAGIGSTNIVGSLIRHAYVDINGMAEPTPLLRCDAVVTGLVDCDAITINVIESVRTNHVVSPDVPNLIIDVR